MNKQKGAKLRVCRDGSMPQLIREDEEEVEDKDKDEEWEEIMRLGVGEEEEEWELEEGDRIFYTALHSENERHSQTSPKWAEEDIQAYSTILM